jgi:hypothetical protein
MTVANANPQPQTCYQIIQDAMVDAGLLGQGDEPNSEDLAEHMRRLNKYVTFLQTKGLKLFVQEDYAFNPTAGQNLYTFGPNGTQVMNKPRRIIEAYYTDNNAVRRPLIGPIGRQEWDTYSTITTQGTVTSFYIDKQLLTLNLYLWLTPDAQAATGQVHVIIDNQIGNFLQVTDQMAFPPEWALCLEWGLAYQISTGQPPSIVQVCRDNWQYFQTELDDWDVEDAGTRFEPDQRGRFVGRRFS